MQASAKQRILVRGVNWLGDAVMSMPALERLREARPGEHLALLTSEKTAPLWEQHPAVDEIIRFSKGEGIWTVSRKLREGKFDVALVLPNSPRSALEVFLAGIPKRVGYARAWRTWLLTKGVRARAGSVLIRAREMAEIQRAIRENRRVAGEWGERCHHMYDYLELAAELGAKAEPMTPKIYVTEEEVEEVRRMLDGSRGPSGLAPGSRHRGWLGLNAGAEYGPAKRWPTERFVETAVEVHRHTGCGCLIYGGPQDVGLAAEIERGIRRDSAAAVENLAGKTSLRQLCGALKLCRVLVTNDTGPMHIGAAVGTKVVALFGSTAPELTGPGMVGINESIKVAVKVQAQAVCSPCFRRECPVDMRCMKGISVSEVVNAVLGAW